MCGIAGMVRLGGGEVDAGALDAMLDAQRHRGPDDRGSWRRGAHALGHVRLSILDLTDRAHQPMVTADGEGVLVYNGEVYNFPALRRDLEAEGATFASHGDTEVVLEALHRWGPERATPRFDGMFAFAYLDRRDGSLWLGRDRFGIKGLLTCEAGDTVLFASEARALLAHPAVSVRVERSRLTHYLLYQRADPRGTLFEGVRPLPPGSLLRIRGTERSTYRWFELPDAIDVDRILASPTMRPERAAEEVRETLTRSVRMHLASDAPLAAMCSGGVDSSLIAALAHDERPELEGYVADVGGEMSEYAQARRAAEHVGIGLRRIPFEREAFLRRWPDAVLHLETPSTHPSDAALLAVVHACRDDGFKVLLTGEGADELFAGYVWYARSHVQWRKARRLARLPVRGVYRRRWKHWRRIPHHGVVFREDEEMRRRLMAAVGAETEERRWRLAEHLRRVEPPEDRAVLVHQLDDLSFHLGWILHRHDRLAMAASIEARVPFLENDLIDLALHLPLPLKLRRRRTKWVLKRVAEERLPRGIVHAPKKGFPVTPSHWLGTERLLTEGGVVPDLLHWSSAATRRLFRPHPAERSFTYQLVSLEIWARLFLRGDSLEAVTQDLLRAAREATPATP